MFDAVPQSLERNFFIMEAGDGGREGGILVVGQDTIHPQRLRTHERCVVLLTLSAPGTANVHHTRAVHDPQVSFDRVFICLWVIVGVICDLSFDEREMGWELGKAVGCGSETLLLSNLS